MHLKVSRFLYTGKSTIGRLYACADGKSDEFICYTLEDVVRSVKIPNETAIPEGTYKLVIDYSQRFKQRMPHILDVPEFEGIRIHSGNIAEDTSGCLLCGTTYDRDFVGLSKAAFQKVFARIQAVGDTTITIENSTGGRGVESL